MKLMKLRRRPALLELRPTDAIHVVGPSREDTEIGTGSLAFHDTPSSSDYLVLFAPTDPFAAILCLTELAEQAVELRDAIAATFPDAMPSFVRGNGTPCP